MTMLRRRKKAARGAKPDAPAGPPSAPATRRRARGTPVPPELLLDDVEEGEPPLAGPARGAPGEAAPVLVTGFDPFGGEERNPSWEVCARLAPLVAGRRVERLRVPCAFRRSIEAVAEAIERLEPALVVCIGQAGGRAQLSVERVAINVDDARNPDNAGERPIDEPIAAGGPPAYFATLPIKAMVAGMRAAGVPAEISNTAGTYVCNHLMYGVLHFLAASGRGARAGFIHVPFAEEQVLDKPGVPALAVATMVRGVEAAIAAAILHAEDIRVSEGRTD